MHYETSLLGLVCLAVSASVVWGCGPALGAPATGPHLAKRSGGGWDVAGRTYTAGIAPDGSLTSLRAGGFEFLAAPTAGPRGLTLGGGKAPAPLRLVHQGRDSLTVENRHARVTMRFGDDHVGLMVVNFAMAPGQRLQLAIRKAVTRIKNPATGAEHKLSAKRLVGPVRLIAPGGATLTMDKHVRVSDGGKVWLVALPAAGPAGSAAAFRWELTGQARPEDQVLVKASADVKDWTFWSDRPQKIYTKLSPAAAGREVRGRAVLRLRSYVTRAVAQELSQGFHLAKGRAAKLTWHIKDLPPCVYIAELWVEIGGQIGPAAAPRLVYHASGMLPPAAPFDFDAFWKRTLAEQAKVPLDLKITKVTRGGGKGGLYKFSFAGLLGRRCYGWLRVPADTSRKYPAVLVLPPAGVRGIHPPRFGPNCVAMAININNVDVDLPNDQYDWRTWPAPYLTEGLLVPEHYRMRFSYAAIVRAAEVLAARPEVQADNILVTGSSQGGGLTFVAAGLYPKFKAAVANVPGLCRLDWNFEHIQPPYFPIAANKEMRPIVIRTLSYFDPVHFARRIKCPIWVSVGLMDDVTPAAGVFCAYNAVRGKRKTMRVMPTGGHGGGLSPAAAAKGVWP